MFRTQEKLPYHTIFLLLLGSKILDLEVTYIGIKNGLAREANPISLYFMNVGGFPLLVVVSLLIMSATSVMIIYMQKKYDRDGFPTIFILNMFTYGCFLFNMLIVLNNCITIYYGIFP